MTAKNEGSETAALAGTPELVLERTFDAPRTLVFDAWTDPKHLARWWGPSGFTNPRCEVDARPGGAIRIDMRGPDGTVYPMTGTFTEVVRPERLAFTAVAYDSEGNSVLEDLTTVTFEERGGRTTIRIEARVLRVSGIGAEYVKGMAEGWSQSVDRLEDLVPSVVPSTDREIVATRTYDAPRDLVFRMWTDPKHIGNWWGPRGFTTTTSEMDVRPGGRWLHVMRGPDGRDYPNEITYVDVVEPRRLVYEHGPAPVFHVTVSFAEEGDRTTVTARMRFASAEQRDGVAKAYGAVEGLHETLGRLAEELQRAGGEFVIARTFDVPRTRMWKAWTERDHLIRWFGPKGFEMFHCTNDLRPGGVMHYGLRAKSGPEMWGRWIYREIVEPERLVFVSSFSDEKGGVTRAPFGGSWPLEMLSTVILEEESGKTKVTVRAVAHGATDEERAFFTTMFGSMKQGWGGTFEQLDAYLARG